MDYKKLQNAIGNPNEWVYVKMDTLGGQCACGKQPIIYRYHIKHISGKLAVVGSECIQYFDGTKEHEKLVDADKKNKATYKWMQKTKKECKIFLLNIYTEIQHKINLKIKNGWSLSDKDLLINENNAILAAKDFLSGKSIDKEKLKFIETFCKNKNLK